MSQQGLRQASVRTVSSTVLDYNGDWHAMWDAQSIPAGTFNERMLTYINTKLSTTYTEINGAMAALAANLGVSDFGSIGTFDASTTPVSTAPVLSNFVDNFDQDPPVATFDASEEGTLTWDFHSSATPPTIGGGDIATGTTLVATGFTNFEPDLTASAGEIGYMHMRLTATDDAQVSNILTSQQFEVPMPIVAVPGNPIMWPYGRMINASSTNTAAAGSTLNSAGYYQGFAFRAKEAMSISHVWFKPATVSGATCTATIKIDRVSDTTGLPAGNLYGATNNATAVTGNLATTTGILTALSETATIAAGEMVAVVFEYNTATSFQTSTTAGFVALNTALPYGFNNTGTPATTAFSQIFNCALGSSTTSFYNVYGIMPNGAAATQSLTGVSTATSGPAAGARFQLPFDCRIAGVYINVASVAGADNFSVCLLDDTNPGTVLGSTTTAFDANQTYSAGANSGLHLMFDTPYAITRNTWYRAVIFPTTTNPFTFQSITIAGADYRTACPGGTNFYYTYRATTTWADNTSVIPAVELIIDQI
jgi:hypothetical protein